MLHRIVEQCEVVQVNDNFVHQLLFLCKQICTRCKQICTPVYILLCIYLLLIDWAENSTGPEEATARTVLVWSNLSQPIIGLLLEMY